MVQNLKNLFRLVVVAAILLPFANSFIDNSNLSASDKTNLKIVITLAVVGIVLVAIDQF